MSQITIAIDGHSSCGKSTVARQLAEKLNYVYIDTGAMYRAVTLFALRNNMIKNNTLDSEALIASVEKLKVEFKDHEGRFEIHLNNENVEPYIRGLEVSNWVSPVSTIGEVRRQMVSLQQAMGRNKGVILDGRDIGTVVFPEAELKIFLTAEADVRAQRRYMELTNKGELVSFDEILQNVKSRDHIDENRTESPLRKAHDAVLIDNSYMSREEQLAEIVRLTAERIGKKAQ